jgi:hypothetical protein
LAGKLPIVADELVIPRLTANCRNGCIHRILLLQFKGGLWSSIAALLEKANCAA